MLSRHRRKFVSARPTSRSARTWKWWRLKGKTAEITSTVIRWQFQRLVSVLGSFDSAINSNQSLTLIERFSYLRASLRGSAAATINGLSLSSANYEAAGALLKERYGDPQQIINAHMDALVNLPIVENIRDLKAMRHLYDEVEANL